MVYASGSGKKKFNFRVEFNKQHFNCMQLLRLQIKRGLKA